MRLSDIFDEVDKELQVAAQKHPLWPTDPQHAMSIVNEEVGELTRATLGYVYEPHEFDLDSIRKEAIQSIAVLVRFLRSFEEYEFHKSKQHLQDL